MNNKTNVWTTLLTLAVLGGVAGAQQSAPGVQMNGAATTGSSSDSSMGGMNTGSMGTAMQSLRKLSGKAFDRAFLSMMIPHHQAALTMSKADLAHNRDPQVRTWANGIISSQQAEIVAMQALLKPLGGPDTAMTSMVQQSMGGMAARIVRSRNPDVVFVEGMLPHHSSAIDMAKVALERSQNPAVLKLAREIVVAQAGEMYAFRTWLLKR
ncbi:DUF305 domain-containing protein [Deinococcus sp. UYEF24]